MSRQAIIAACILVPALLTATDALAQIEEARQAIGRGEPARAVTILSDALREHPTADIYLYLGIAHGHLRDYRRAEAILKEGSEQYPQDLRFHNELAGVYLALRQVEMARSSLQRALDIDPQGVYASDLLATIEMSEGQVQSALQIWNRTGRPVVGDILHNYHLTFEGWFVRKAVAFRPAGLLSYGDWKTTEARLFEANSFANAGLEIEPTLVPAAYNAVVRTTSKTTSRRQILFDLIKGVPIETSYFDLWNIRNSGVNFNLSYRWETDRRRADSQLKIPLPLPGILFLEAGQTWRNERWDLSRLLPAGTLPSAQFHYKANSLRLHLKHIPHYRFQIGGGLEYVNRAAAGDLPELFTDNRNTGRWVLDTEIRPTDRDRYKNRLHLHGFAARESILGDFNYTGGTAELNNRITISDDTQTFLDWTFKGGSTRGRLPVEDYFSLGVETNPRNLLRGHAAARGGRYGSGPMGTDFGLVNLELERRLRTIPLFNTFNIPYITVKAGLFLDAARTSDRHGILERSRFLVDTGAKLKFETPTVAFNLGYGRSLRDGSGVFFSYIERRLW